MVWRINRLAVGLTYSAPKIDDVSQTNPLDELWGEDGSGMKDYFFERYSTEDRPIIKYVFGREPHEAGTHHYHLYLKWGSKIDTVDVRYFDVLDVHPNVCEGGSPGEGWIKYCAGEGKACWNDFISNFFQRCPFALAFAMANVTEAENLLIQKRPRDMAINGKQIRENLEKRAKKPSSRVYYFGPQRPLPGVDEMSTKTIILQGEVGSGKTQLANYWAKHLYGGYFYCKGSLEALKYYNDEPCIVFDDIKVAKYEHMELDDLFDVESGGTLTGMRYRDITVPPGPKIWLQNPGVVIPDPYGRIYGRRAVVYDF